MSTDIEAGIPTLHDLLSPGGFDRSRMDRMRVGPHYAKSLVVTGLPSEIGVGWLGPFLSFDGSLDLAIHIDPYDDRGALHSLTTLITRLKARYHFAANIQGQGDDLLRAVADAERIRDMVSANVSRLFKVTTVATLYDRSEERLEDLTALVDGRLAGRHIYAKVLEARQDEAYQAALPFGINFVNDVHRNLDSYAAATVLPFTDGDLFHAGGYQFGVNYWTRKPIIFNPYDKSLNNHNIICYAASGSGKSATIKTHLGRSIFTGERSAVLDPEGEYAGAAEVLGGVVIRIGPGSEYKLNPFDVYAEEDPDSGQILVKLGPKILDLIDLVGTMVGGLTPEELAVTEQALRQLYHDFGITADPESLYSRGSVPDPDRPGLFKHGRQPKKMPQLSDLVQILQPNPAATRLVSALGPYVGQGVLAFFDCQSTVTVDRQWLTVFDLSLLDERLGKPVALQVAMVWLWDSFIKRNPRQKKRVVVDEAWLLADHEPAMRFLENVVRRARKRSAGLTIISQDFRKFSRHPRGESIHSNSATMILLRAEDVDLDELQETFKLSQGERHFLSTCGKGSGILRVKGRPMAFHVQHTPSEAAWVYTTPLRPEIT